MNKKVVVALGGNALGSTLAEQMAAVRNTAKAIADLTESGFDIVIAHGNGPQVGMINNAFAEYAKKDSKFPYMPLSMCVAMSQAYIGYDLQNALREEYLNRGIKKDVTSIITQVVVDEKDPAFERPTKPIGPFMTEQEAEAARAMGMVVVEDSGRGYRRVVASPKPQDIVEIETVEVLIKAGEVVIACGGGGIPVIEKEDGSIEGIAAVIDKDFAAEKLAEDIDADILMILTEVEKVSINFKKPDQHDLPSMTVDEAKKYIEEGHFAPGSMLPKIMASVKFVKNHPDRKAIITSLYKSMDALNGLTGTVVQDI